MTFLTLCLTLFMIHPVSAKAPECPEYGSRGECLQAVNEGYFQQLEFIDELETDEGLDDDMSKRLFTAANDIRLFETKACHQTCVD